jgi:hypothetical protein
MTIIAKKNLSSFLLCTIINNKTTKRKKNGKFLWYDKHRMCQENVLETTGEY